MNPLHSRSAHGSWPRRLAGLAGVAASTSTLALVIVLFWNQSRHAVDAPSYTARMQHCQSLPGAGARRQCVDQTFAQAVERQGGRQFAAAGLR